MRNSDFERKMQHNSIVIQLNAAMAQPHKKCNFANFTLIFLLSETVMTKQTNLASLLLLYEMLPFRVHVA